MKRKIIQIAILTSIAGNNFASFTLESSEYSAALQQ